VALPKPLSTSCLEIIVQGIMMGQTIENVYHYQGVQPVGSDELSFTLDELLLAFADEVWRAAVIPKVSEHYSVERYIARELSGNQLKNPNDTASPTVITARQFTQLSGGEDDVGDLVGDFIPTFNAMTYYLQTGLHGRHGAGHTRIGGLTKAQVKATPSGQSLADATWTSFNNDKSIFAFLQIEPAGAPDKAVPCLFWRTPVLKNHPPTIDDMRPFMKLYNTATTRRLITSQVSRKQRNRGGQ